MRVNSVAVCIQADNVPVFVSKNRKTMSRTRGFVYCLFVHAFVAGCFFQSRHVSAPRIILAHLKAVAICFQSALCGDCAAENVSDARGICPIASGNLSGN